MLPPFPVSYLPNSSPKLTALVWLPKPSWKPLRLVFGIHGGGLISGSANEIPEWIKIQADKHGFAIISLEYRLLLGGQGGGGGVKGAVDDVARQIDAALAGGFVRALHESGNHSSVELSQFGIVGWSAGGYLALLAATATKQMPAFSVILYPAVQLLSPFYSSLHRPPDFHHAFQLSKVFLSNSTKWVGILWDGPVLTSTPPPADYNHDVSDEGEGCPPMLWFAALHLGCLPQICAGGRGIGKDGKVIHVDEEKIVKAVQHILPLETPGLDLKESFPPLWILHGAQDVVTSPEDSVFVKRKLDEAGVECHLHIVEGSNHGFDLGASDGLVDWNEIGDWASQKLTA